MEKQVVIFCASSQTIDPKYNKAAREVARGLHRKGYSIVSGGTVLGTMGAITDESIRCGGAHTAVLPHFMAGMENTGVSRVLWTDTMSARKELMRANTVAAIALPGGIGTLDELMETHTLRKLKKYNGEIFVLNLDGFYNPLKALLDRYVQTEMTAKADIDLIKFVNTPQELLENFE